MSSGTTSILCTIPEELQAKIKSFRFRKSTGTSAFIIKINKDAFQFEQDALLDACSLDDVAEELPDTQPRFVILSYEYKHEDGRLSYPLVFFYYSPTTVKLETNMLYASAKAHLVQQCDIGKVYDVRDLSCFNDKWLKDKLAFFK